MKKILFGLLITLSLTSCRKPETLIKHDPQIRRVIKFEFEDFKTPLEVCIERDSKRPNKIGAEKITEIYNKYKKFYEE